MRVVYDKSLRRVELIPESASDRRSLDGQFGPWEDDAGEVGLRGPAGDNFEFMICRRENDGAVLIEIALAPEGDE
jgi:hypothetical protein